MKDSANEKSRTLFTTASVDLQKKKNTHESLESNFIGGKMKSIVWETAPKIALRNYSKDGQYICDFVEGVYIFFAHFFLLLFKN